ncbi:MAG: tetratricopeptide repeat protein [Alphaproteobacteria bacterium]|nr:tetratricopeptide repeat protein [Alphaproteobacteria bacterium]MDP6590654.1 tetratricopeptide repeat protein [Alphaproteobacteria bacterium]MDP6818949.1 tetratricopeptide repeat protein [Alphaproteobacteria bacterium]
MRIDRAAPGAAQAPAPAPADRSEILNMAVRHHQAGRLDEADGLYRLLLEVEPGFAEALHLSGLIRLERNQLGEALELIARAIAADPGNAAYHGDLGRAHMALEDSEAALASLRRAVELGSNSAASLAGMGRLLHRLERFDEAIECLQQARRAAPDSPDIECDLGSAHDALNRRDKAVACYRRAIEIDPGHAQAHSNLGLALFDLGDLQGAVAHGRRAVELQPDAPAAHLNLGWALFGSADNSQAREHFEAAIKLAPEMSEAQSKLALCYLSSGDIEDAHEHFKRAAQLAVRPRRRSAPFKLSHDIDQMRHLYARGVAGDDIQRIIAGYESVRDAMPYDAPQDEIFTLNQAQRDKLNPSYDSAYYIPACPMRDCSALGRGVEQKPVESSYFSAQPNFAVIDNLLSHDTLLRLRAFCREATIWKQVGRGHLGARLEDGFGEPLLLQIAHELRRGLPAILADHPLIDMWAHKCDQQFAGLAMHADRAAVNVNFWISPDDANCDPKSGGLELFRAQAPLAWDFRRHRDAQEDIERILEQQGGASTTIPHRSNRAVIFDSNLFHRTADLRFRNGYINRRTNITMLFGNRYYR